MKNKIKIIIIILILGLIIPTTASSAATSLPTDTSIPSSGCILAGVYGSYVSDKQKALDRINDIRKEACKEGIINPSTGAPLTLSDYVPIKWSSDLEYIAKIRAAEGGVYLQHMRPNGDSFFDLISPGGQNSWGEVLAWNSSSDMIHGINQWYEEKYDWVHKTGGETGHYTQMIDPEHTYVGLGAFVSDNIAYGNCTAGEFSYEPGASEGFSEPEKNILQTIEINKTLVGKARITNVSGMDEFYAGRKEQFHLTYNVSESGATLYSVDNITWTSSDESVVYVDSNGIAHYLTPGKATIQASSPSGEQSSMSLKILPKAPGRVKIKSMSSSKGKLTVKWNKTVGANGYDIVYSTDSSFYYSKTIKINGNKTSKAIKGLKRKTKYYIMVRAYNKASTGISYGEYSKVKSRKTK